MYFRLVTLIMVILLQKADLTVDKTLAGPYNLVVGLRCSEDGTCSASGSLYKGSEAPQNKLTFTAFETVLIINGSCSSCILQNVSVYGLRAPMTSCTIVTANNGAKCIVKEEKGVIEINGLQLDLSNLENFTIEWEFETEDLESEEPDK